MVLDIMNNGGSKFDLEPLFLDGTGCGGQSLITYLSLASYSSQEFYKLGFWKLQ